MNRTVTHFLFQQALSIKCSCYIKVLYCLTIADNICCIAYVHQYVIDFAFESQLCAKLYVFSSSCYVVLSFSFSPRLISRKEKKWNQVVPHCFGFLHRCCMRLEYGKMQCVLCSTKEFYFIPCQVQLELLCIILAMVGFFSNEFRIFIENIRWQTAFWPV